MANLIRKRENEPSTTTTGMTGRVDPFRTFRDLFRWDPLGRDMFRLLDPFADIEPAALQGAAVFVPEVEMRETPDAFIVQMDLPGVEDEDVEVTISGNRVTISGKREAENRREGDRYYTYERSYGTFSRSFTLPEGVDMDRVVAALDHGVLALTIPKREASQARRITVGQKGEQQKGEQKGEQASAAQAAGREEQAPTARETKEKEKEQAGQRKAA